MKDIKIKICGMKDPANISEVIRLDPDYLGFILYEKSPRYVSINEAETLVKNIPSAIKKTGVIVDEPLERAISIAEAGSSTSSSFMEMKVQNTVCGFLSM
jgi:phosphoribosylanthranilate isomerase